MTITQLGSDGCHGLAAGSASTPDAQLRQGSGHRQQRAWCVQLGAGEVCITVSAETHVVVDVSGYVGPRGQLYTPLASLSRVHDSRGAPDGYGPRTRKIQVAESAGFPDAARERRWRSTSRS
ncbi:MAG: hypothetical protein R2705_16060 [Ilumatobacteraceae bacterium]